MCEFRLAGVAPESIVDGPGLRYTIFFQGCQRNCKGCHNPSTWGINGGRVARTEDIIRAFCKNPLLAGITLSGGEPFRQPRAAYELASAAKAMGLGVWCWTGYTLEELQVMEDPDIREVLKSIDVLVDGEYRHSERSLELPWRGSKNQRVIHMVHGKVQSIE